MSIFCTKEFWSAAIDKSNKEEFDYNSIAVGNVDNSPNNQTKICISSMKGTLRIYEPHFRSDPKTDLLFEKKYPDPILQIRLGNYLPNLKDVQLAVLQSKKISVYTITNLHGATQIKLNFDNNLKRNGNNFTSGKIGEKNYEVLFVQSVDGALMIFEQSSLINMISFSEVIFPGPIAFLSMKDYFCFANTAYEIEAYEYNSLATIKSTGNTSGAQKISHLWKSNIGELSKQIEVVLNDKNKKEEMVVLSETMLNLLDSDGRILYQRKLDYEPMCIKAYNITDENYKVNRVFDLMVMVSTSLNHLLIYKGYNLAWAAKLYDSPIYVGFGDFDTQRNLIVTLSDYGNLSILYLGMEPIKNVKIIPSKELEISYMKEETEKLNEIIDSYSKGEVTAPDTTLSISAEVKTDIKLVHEQGDKLFFKDNFGKIFYAEVVLGFSYSGEMATNINVCIVCPHNVLCDEPSFMITSLGKKMGEKKKVFKFRVLQALYPSFTNVEVYASYYVKDVKKNEKISMSSCLSFELPMSLFLRISHDNKKSESDAKITLLTDKDPLPLNKIFKELTEDSYCDSNLFKQKTNSATFIYPNQTDVTVLVSKQNGRYRIQSNNFQTLLFITHQMVLKLKEAYEDKIECYIDDPINFAKYMEAVIKHYELFIKKTKMSEELEKYTNLYTEVQKSLLNKYKAKNPPKFFNLDFLLKQVYKEIQQRTDDIIKTDKEMKGASLDIQIWTELMLYLLKLRSQMNEKSYSIIKGIFPLDNINSNEECWEGMTLTNMANAILYYFKQEPGKISPDFKDSLTMDKWKKYFMTLLKETIANKGFKVED